MGLDTTHNCWHGSYSSFKRWREQLAIAGGYKIKTYTGIDRNSYRNTWTNPDLEWEKYPEKCYVGNWSKVEKPLDPLVYLLVHSDCDGAIRPAQGKLLLKRLIEIYDSTPADEPLSYGYGFKECLEKFIDGLSLAVKEKKSVKFH